MAGKKVSFGTKPQKQPDVDAWVESREASTEDVPKEVKSVSSSGSKTETKRKTNKSEQKEEQGAMKRLTLDIPETLHRRIKGKAVMEGVTMVNMLRELLEENYG